MKNNTRNLKENTIETDSQLQSNRSISAIEEERKKIAERKDSFNLLEANGKCVEDQDEKMLIPPAIVEKVLSEKLYIAKTPPKVTFGIIPYADRYFPEIEEGNDYGPWSSWGQVCYDPENDSFFGAVGDHGWYDCRLHLVQYTDRDSQVKCLPEINKVLNRKPSEFGEAKIHGYLDIYRADYQENDHLWFCTYWCKYLEPSDKDFDSGYTGGHIMSYDLKTKQFCDYGVPLTRASWPYHKVDTKHGILYGIGMFGEFLSWDINERKIKWAGYPPSQMVWYNRCLLVDEASGIVYTNNAYHDDMPLMKYDPFRNRFFATDIVMPKNNDGLVAPIRCHTLKPDKTGKYWGLTALGNLFSFDIKQEKIEMVETKLWPLDDAYSVSIEQSPNGRYLYFGIGCHGRSYPYGAPILQYDILTEKLKILAFLHPFYYEKYGYVPGGTYALKLNETGDKLFMIWNGDFTDIEGLLDKYSQYDSATLQNWSIPSDHDAFGHCSVFVLDIPSEERQE